MQWIESKESLFTFLGEDAWVITPNNRLSAALQKDYFIYRKTKTVKKPFCQPYHAMLIQAYQRLAFRETTQSYPPLLSENQCQHLWRTLIQSNTHYVYSEGLLQAVLQAWHHCEQWQIDPAHPLFDYTTQTKQFQFWWQEFKQKIARLGVNTEYQVVPALLSASSPLFITPVIWTCFDDFTPQQQTLQAHWQQQGINQYRYDLSKPKVNAHKLTAKTSEDEQEQLIAWLQLKIAQGERSIAVVVPELQQLSQNLQRRLSQYFPSSVFNISLGQPLYRFALVAHALIWLSLNNTELSQQDMCFILQSPYIGSAKDELVGRSQYVQDFLLAQKRPRALKRFICELRPFAPKLAELLDNLSTYPDVASPAQWVGLFHQRLNGLGFPGDYGLNSESYQCYQRFTALLDEFCALNSITPTLDKDQAIEELTYLAQNTIFQSQKTNATIQILGLLEASGCEFDSVWVMGLSDNCLPQKPKLSAFIPAQLQRNLLMPHSTPARELLFAQQILHRLHCGSSSSVVFSYSALKEDSPQLPCSLITDFGELPPLFLLEQSAVLPMLIESEEPYLIPIQPQETLTGGSALLGHQAKCPFKAFAEYRLAAKPLAQSYEGIDNKDRGILIHNVLELIWQELKNQHVLSEMIPSALEKLIDQTLCHALAKLNDSPAELVQDVERTRLKRLITACLAWEKQRPYFAIEALEQAYSIDLAGLTITLRVDRIDVVGDKKWIIDYKSSLPLHKPWNEERPQEPQLLLYSLLDENINTFLFLQVKSGRVVASGLSEEKLMLKGISPLKKEDNWSNSRHRWQQQLNSLAGEIQQGHCPPQPLNGTICQQCAFQMLCRYPIDV